MKRKSNQHEDGSILMVALLTITILTMICATTLYVTSQSMNATTQTTSWQQAMAGAEAAADQAMKALNTTGWTAVGPNGERWYTVTSSSLPSSKPNPSSTPFATAMPGNGQYNYYSTSFALQGEPSNSITMWVTVDNGSVAPVSTNLVLPTPSPAPASLAGYQGYRIRAAAVVGAPGPARVSNNKLDNDLRKISLRYDRLAGTAVTNPQAVRRIELVAIPVTQVSLGSPAIALAKWINMSGGGVIDSFDSRNSAKSTGGQYDPAKRQKNANIGTQNSNQSDLHSTYVYGNLAYSGPAVKNSSHVQGTISTPFAASIPATTSPDHDSGLLPSWNNPPQNFGGGSPPFSSTGTLNPSYVSVSGNTAFIKVNGDFTVGGGDSVSLVPATYGGNSITNYVIWVTGKYTTSGSGYVTQSSGVTVKWYVGSDMTTSGSAYQNQGGLASSVAFIGYGNKKKVTISGSGNFIGTVNAPAYDMTISGSGFMAGAIIASTLTISGGASFHFDEALAGGSGGNGGLANYAYASWFEDNSDPARGIIY